MIRLNPGCSRSDLPDPDRLPGLYIWTMYETVLVPTGSFWLLHLYWWTDVTMQGCAYLVGWSIFSLLLKGAKSNQTYLGSLVFHPSLGGLPSLQLLSNICMHKESPGRLWESRFLGPCPRDSDSVRLEWAWEHTCLTSSQVIWMVWDSMLAITALVEYPWACFLPAQGPLGIQHDITQESTHPYC